MSVHVRPSGETHWLGAGGIDGVAGRCIRTAAGTRHGRLQAPPLARRRAQAIPTLNTCAVDNLA